MNYLPYILLFVAICAFGGMVFDTPDEQTEAKWPLVYTPMFIVMAVGMIALCITAVVGEIVVRVFTLGAYGYGDIK